ncbi:uncharacterized protein LOC142983420 isoform X2 [Anticarsia gemmatalis]|uniref:uncharacterized protein LOC142983420 isoform X2 n=1 Tax=Anticarsia gemmatalis TaxID=129554 RepID=UPI003F776C76
MTDYELNIGQICVRNLTSTVVRNVCEGETLVNGRPVSVAALRHGDVISIGGRQLRWDYAEPSVRRIQSPQPALYVARRKGRAARRGSGPAPAVKRERALQLAIEMSHRASMPASAGGKQVAIVQPQRRDTTDQNDKPAPRTPIQANKRPRSTKSELDTSLTEDTKRKSWSRASPKTASSSLHSTTKATLWIESRKSSPRKSARPPRRSAASAKKSTPLRLTVLKRAQSAQKMNVTKIEAPLKIDHTKQAAILLMTGHTPKSKLAGPKTPSPTKSESPKPVTPKPPSPKPAAAQSTSPKSGGRRSASFVAKKSAVKRSTPRSRSSRSSVLSTSPRDRTVTILEITDSDGRNSTLRNSSRRSGQKSFEKSPLLPSPRKSALKNPLAKRNMRKTESIKFDLSNLENHSQESDVMMVTDTSRRSGADSSVDEHMSLRYSESSAALSPSPRRAIHSRSGRILEKSIGATRTLSPSPRTLTPHSPRARKSLRGSAMVQKALNESDDTLSYSRRATKSVSSTNNSQNASASVASAFRTRTLSPRSPQNNMESYSIVDLVSIDSNESGRSTSVYNSAGSTNSTAFGTPQTSTGRKTRSTIDPTLLGSSTPYVKITRSYTLDNSSKSNNSRSTNKSSVSTRKTQSVSTPENTTKHISVNSTRVSRASRSRSRINDSDLLLIEDEADDSPRTSKRISTASKRSNSAPQRSSSGSLNTTPVGTPGQNEGTSTPENRHSPEEASTPVLSIQSLLDSSQSSLTSRSSKGRGQSLKRKTIGVLSGPKTRVSTKSKSMTFSARKTRLRLSNDSYESMNVSTLTDNEIVTPKSAVKLVQEAVKNKHSTAKKPQSKRSIIDDLNESDVVKQLFNSPVKRKLSQSMTEFSRKQLFDDDDIVQVKRLTRNTVALTGRTPDNSLLEHTEAFTPERFVSPMSTPSQSPNLEGIKLLFGKRTPDNDLRNVRGVKALLRTPRARKSIRNDLTDVGGVKIMFAKSPRNRLSDVRVKEVFAASPKNDLRRVSGVKSLFQTQQKRKSPRNSLGDVRGVKKLFNRGSPVNDLRNVSGVKKTLKRNSPRNDLSDVQGVKQMFRRSKRNELNDLSGVEELFNEINNTHTDMDSIFDQLIGKPPIKAVYSKTFTSKSAPKKKSRKNKSLHSSLNVITNNVEAWLEQELAKRLNKEKEEEAKSANTSTYLTRELQKLATDTVEGTEPIRESRIRNSTIIRTSLVDAPRRQKSASELYSAHTLPIKKRSLVDASLERGGREAAAVNLPIKKRAVLHSTPVKGRAANMTMNASELGRVSPIVAERTQDLEHDVPRGKETEAPKTRRGTRAAPKSPKFVKPSPKKTRVKAKAPSPTKPVTPTKDKSPAKPKTPNPVKKPASPVTKVISPKPTRSRRAAPVTPPAVTNTKKRGTTLVVKPKSPVMSPRPESRASRKRKEPETVPSPKASPKRTRGTRNKEVVEKPKSPKNTRTKVQKASVVVSKPSPRSNPRATRGKAQQSTSASSTENKTNARNKKTESPKKSQDNKKAKEVSIEEAPKTRGRKTTANNEVKNNSEVEQPAARPKRGRPPQVAEPIVKKTRKTDKQESIQEEPKKTRKTNQPKEETKPVRGKKAQQGTVQPEATTRSRRGTKVDNTVVIEIYSRKRKTTAADDRPAKLSKNKEAPVSRGRSKRVESPKTEPENGPKRAVAKESSKQGSGDAPKKATRSKKVEVEVEEPKQKTGRGRKAAAVVSAPELGKRKRKTAVGSPPVEEASKKARGGRRQSPAGPAPPSPPARATRSAAPPQASKTAGRTRRR